MGGDHKCPVCQATFTRPQHVARHMRSHTGDRPYKCQFCGDQFARSDLLSRHVNKCHADEKPPPNLPGSRRKAVSASRATTSKQACDQCVQSSLPCDGGCPCGKCLHRQRPCTFVKFHRQTAPVGPGHHNSSTTHPPPHLLSQSSSSATLYPIAPAQNPNRYPLYPPQDELLLGPSPGSQSMPENMYNPELAFSSLYPHQGDPMDVSGDPAAMDHVMMQYKISADQVRRSSMAGGVGTLYDAPPEQPQKPEWMAWDSQHQPYHEKDNHPTQQQYAPIQALPRFNYHHHPPPSSGSSSTSTSSSGHGHGHGHNSGLPPSSFPSYMLTSDRVVSGTMQHPQHHHHHQRHQRQSPLGRRGSHSESSNSPSGQTSAASSSIHLPISDITAPTPNVNVNLPGPGSMSSYDVGGVNLYRGHAPHQHQNSNPSSHPSSHSTNSNQPLHQQQQQQQYPTNDPAFSSAFGLMSLDDAAVLAGLARDGQPFFSGGADAEPEPPGVKMEVPYPDTTPLGNPGSGSNGGDGGSGGGNGQMIKEEADSRVVRELWRKYISTPFSGPDGPAFDRERERERERDAGSGVGGGRGKEGDVSLSGKHPTSNSNFTAVQRNGDGYTHVSGYLRRHRVNSLPDAGKIHTVQHEFEPTLNKSIKNINAYNNNDNNNNDKNQQNTAAALRTLYSRDDLRSYEAAVLSRAPPAELRLPAKKKSGGGGGSSRSADTSPMVPARAYSGGGAASSSLAHAFGIGLGFVQGGKVKREGEGEGEGEGGQHVTFVDGVEGEGREREKERLRETPEAVSSRESSLGVEDRASVDSSGSAGSGERLSVRPSFKRLPSQTLEPVSSKRTLLMHPRDAGSGGEEVETTTTMTTTTTTTTSEYVYGRSGTGSGSGSGQVGGWHSQSRLQLGGHRGSKSLAERRRRMSAPSGIGTPGGAGAGTGTGAGHRVG